MGLYRLKIAWGELCKVSFKVLLIYSVEIPSYAGLLYRREVHSKSLVVDLPLGILCSLTRREVKK